MKQMILQFVLPGLILSLLLPMAISTFGQEKCDKTTNREKGVPGKQVLQSMELPANMSFWTGKIEQLGVPKPGDPAKKETISYWLFLPQCDTAKTAAGYPLLLFLHGAGERGNNPELVKVHGPAKIVETEAGKTWPFITVSPQCPKGKYWSPQILLKLLDEIERTCPVDKSRVYVTGLSMGGFGSWMLLREAPNRFAAAAPVCGGGDPDWAPIFKDIPIWVFHGDADGAVNPEFSKKLVQAIKDAGGKKVKLTIYPGVGHNSWNNAYSDPELWKWFLEQKR